MVIKWTIEFIVLWVYLHHSSCQWVPGFLGRWSWKFPERLRNKSELVGSEEVRQVLTGHPGYETLSNWILLRLSLVTLPSISSETWVIYSWAVSGSSVFCDWLFLVFSGVFPVNAANLLLFFKNALILREKFCQLWRLNWSYFFSYQKCYSPFIMNDKGFIKCKQLKISNSVQYRKATTYITSMVLSFLLFVPFLGGKHNCLHAKSRYK